MARVRAVSGGEDEKIMILKANTWYKDNKRPKSMLFYCGHCLERVYDFAVDGKCRYKYCPFCGVGKENTVVSYGMPEVMKDEQKIL